MGWTNGRKSGRKRLTNYSAELVSPPEKKKDQVSFKVEYSTPDTAAKVVVKYFLHASGELNVDYTFTPLKNDLPNIPRLGMYLSLPQSFTEVSWYGKGPEESYWDRKSGQKTGVYSGKVREQLHVYSRPQETGNKTDVRWMQLSSPEMHLKMKTARLLNASVWPFSMTELDHDSNEGAQSASGLVPVTKKHGADIQFGQTIQWNIDLQQMGVGGDTSWGRLVHEEYTLPADQTYSYSFTISPQMRADLNR